MANTDNPNGFRPLNANNARVTPYKIEGDVGGTAYSEDLFIGDMVTLSSGYCIIATAGTANQLLGPIIGFTNNAGFDTGYYPDDSPAEWWALVADDPHERFVAQDDAGGTLTIANVGGTVNIKTTHSGNASTNMSGQEIDSSAVSGAVTDQLRLVGIVERPDNVWGDNGEYIVEIHNHIYRQENNVDATS